jgi:repressor LexA
MHVLKELRKQKGMRQADIAQKLGVGRTTYVKYENGDNEPSFEMLNKLSDLFGVSIDYLLGRDSGYEGSGAPVPTRPGSKWIPVLGKVAAGVPIEAVEDILDYEEISAQMAEAGDYFALQIKGDSMEPKISNGDVVIVRKQPDVESGETAVVLVNGNEATVKRIKKRPEGIMLIPTNPAYEPMFYSAVEVEKLPVVILGKVVELRAKY